jgi:hypothetical protein
VVELIAEVLGIRGKLGYPVGPGVGRTVIPTDVPLTVPVPSPLNVRIPSTELETENASVDEPGTASFGCRLDLNPEFGKGVVFPGLGAGPEPGANRQAAPPVNPYDPWRNDGNGWNGSPSAAALAAQVKTKADAEKPRARCIVREARQNAGVALNRLFIFYPLSWYVSKIVPLSPRRFPGHCANGRQLAVSVAVTAATAPSFRGKRAHRASNERQTLVKWTPYAGIRENNLSAGAGFRIHHLSGGNRTTD